MIHPFTAILIGLLFLSLLFILFWPKKGIIDRWVRGRLNSQRILLEDALKYLYDCEYKNKISTLNSVAGNMNISGDESTKTLTRLEKMGLISFGEGAIKLTDRYGLLLKGAFFGADSSSPLTNVDTNKYWVMLTASY